MSFHRNEPPLPKPFGFVSLPNHGPRQAAPAGHHTYRADLLTGQVRGEFVARSDVHVASGLLAHHPRDRQYPLVQALTRSNGRVVIPGASLKGCIRAIVEAISPSTVHITQARLGQHDRALAPVRPRDLNLEHLDPATRLFGAQGYLGAVHVRDALLDGDYTVTTTTPTLYRPRREAASIYHDGPRLKGRKFYMHGERALGKAPREVCPPESRFQFVADFDNLSAAELGLLLTALGIGEPRFCPKLGGAKPACMGTIEVTRVQVQVLQPQRSYTDFDSQGEAQDTEPLLAAAREERLVLVAQLAELADLLRWPPDNRHCPDRPY